MAPSQSPSQNKASNPLADALGLSVYIHFPWCLKKCPYCDFLSVALFGDGEQPSEMEGRRRIPHRRYADAVLQELASRISRIDVPEPGLRSIFFGGGTPSLWEPEELGRVIQAVRESIPAAPGPLEITVECNPTSIDPEHLERLASVGVNRVSIGVQGLEKERLAFLGRLHDADQGLRAVANAQASSIARTSADLIFGVYREQPEIAAAEAKRASELGITHLSAYALTIEEGTRFGALHRQRNLPLLSESLVAKSFSRVSETLIGEGFVHYEISNFCREGHESVHNLGYWMGRDYLGLGTGAYGTVSLKKSSERLRYKNLLSPERYETTFSQKPSFDPFLERLSERELIPPDIALEEALLLGLRTARGVHLEEMARLRGGHAWPDERREAKDRLLREGRLQIIDGRLRIPHAHWLFADAIIRDLI